MSETKATATGTVSAVITRADGTVEDLGVISTFVTDPAHFEPEPLVSDEMEDYIA